MAERVLQPRPLTAEEFAPFGKVIDLGTARSWTINNGTTTRFDDLASVETAGTGARPLVNLFRAQPFTPPISISMMERHPLGSQAFIATAKLPWLVVVAPDGDGAPGDPVAFLVPGTGPVIGVNYRRNVWHHPLLALQAESDFVVVDRGGDGVNLEECAYGAPWLIESCPAV